MNQNPQKVSVVISNQTIVRVILWIVAAMATYRFVGRISHILTLIFVSIFLAMALNPVVAYLRRRLHIASRVRATAAAYLLVVTILVTFFSLIIPPLVSQTRDFIKDVPSTVENFQSQDNGISRAIKKYNLDEKISQGSKEFASNYSGFGATVLDTSKRIGEAVASFAAVFVLTFMLIVEGPSWVSRYFKALPQNRREHQKMIAQKMYKAVTGFVNGQVILAVVAGFFAFIALEIAGHVLGVVSNAVALAGIVAVFGIIPLFGNPLAAFIVVLVSLLNSANLAIIMAIYFLIYFFIENHTFQPYIQSKMNDLTPLTVFVAALVGVGFGGILGAIVAIPAATTIKILIEDYFDRHKLSLEKT